LVVGEKYATKKRQLGQRPVAVYRSVGGAPGTARKRWKTASPGRQEKKESLEGSKIPDGGPEVVTTFLCIDQTRKKEKVKTGSERVGGKVYNPRKPPGRSKEPSQGSRKNKGRGSARGDHQQKGGNRNVLQEAATALEGKKRRSLSEKNIPPGTSKRDSKEDLEQD